MSRLTIDPDIILVTTRINEVNLKKKHSHMTMALIPRHYNSRNIGYRLLYYQYHDVFIYTGGIFSNMCCVKRQ